MSTTALAEYMDMLFSRLSLALRKDYMWRLELRPDPSFPAIDQRGYVVIHVDIPPFHHINYYARMNAVESNAPVPLHILSSVVDHHVMKLLGRMEETKNKHREAAK